MAPSTIAVSLILEHPSLPEPVKQAQHLHVCVCIHVYIPYSPYPVNLLFILNSHTKITTLPKLM